jgi:hypothetical protein
VRTPFSKLIDWAVAINPQLPVDVDPGGQAAGNINFTIPSSIPVGIYTITVTVANTTSGLSTRKSFPIQVVSPPRIDSLNPASGGANTPVEIRGQGFSVSPTWSVYISGANSYAILNDIQPVDNTHLNIVFPSQMDTNGCVPGTCPVPVTPGIYRLRLFGGALSSNEADFQVTASGAQVVSDPHLGR